MEWIAAFHVLAATGRRRNWILSHTRPDYPQDALESLGMRPLKTAYQRANNCVACHQNLSDELVAANHPALVFELDGLLVAEPKHWREEEEFSPVKTWLVGQAVALRETAAQAIREPGPAKSAETEAISALLKETGTGWTPSQIGLVRAADDFAKKTSGATFGDTQSREIFRRLVKSRVAFGEDAFGNLDEQSRIVAVGHYCERLALAMDRLNQALGGDAVPHGLLNDLFDAAKPPESFDDSAQVGFLKVLDRMANPNLPVD